MPMYEYRCESCDRPFEKLRRMSEADSATSCPHCQSSQVKRELSCFATTGCGGGGRFT
ncbi:MAG: zinc ribbon domain-containing protein [Acidobacteria bacterium]|nr:zinc ribbon domain-containing protein [Acidobacteriota bacterium]